MDPPPPHPHVIFCKHVASRVASLPDLVQRANDYRAITGAGFSFLDIPRTYYGLLDAPFLAAQAAISPEVCCKLRNV